MKPSELTVRSPVPLMLCINLYLKRYDGALVLFFKSEFPEMFWPMVLFHQNCLVPVLLQRLANNG